MNSRLGIACLMAAALIALGVAGCTKSTTPGVTPIPTPTASASIAPDTLYVQTSASKEIRVYKGASALNGLASSSSTYPTSDISNGDVIYNPVTDTLWYTTAYPGGINSNQSIETWETASTMSGMNPILVPFSFGEGAQAYDPTHNLLFVATTAGPQVSVYTSPNTFTAASTASAVITMQIADGSGPTPRPQEMYYDPATDRMFVSDQVSVIAVFDGFGSAAEAAVVGHTNPTIVASREMTGLSSPDGLAYSHSADVLFVGEQQQPNGFIDVIHNASSFSGPVGHTQEITGFSHPGGLAFDDTSAAKGILFVYDTTPIYIIPTAITASGALNNIKGLHIIVDSSATQNTGFGISLDPTH
jgi:hypothetical protein